MVLEQIYAVITADQDVIDIMGARLYPMRLPQSAQLPAAVYQLITTAPEKSLDGDSGLDLLRVQVKTWADTYTEAHDLATAIRAALRGAASLTLTTELVDDDEDQATKSFAKIMQFSVWSEFDESAVSPPATDMPYTFEGDDVTKVFPFPEIFPANTLMLFRNGVLAEKDVVYFELSDRSGVSFPTAPAGGTYKDRFAAFWR